jgi:predicted ribosomally synthesized peptide with SipW-like signal peptide
MWTHRRRALVLLLAVGLVLGIGGGATYAAFSSTTSNGGNSFGVKADFEPPTVVRSIIGRTSGQTPGFIQQGATYFVYAQITDGGNPAAGINTATTNVCTITSAACGSVTLSSGAFTAGGVNYNYRSASQTADNPLSAGSKSYSVSASDLASPVNSVTSNFTVTVDNSNPSGTDIQTANVGSTVGKAEATDTITWTFSEAMDPSSLKAGWDGTGSQSVTVAFLNNGCGGGNDSVTVTGVNLGAVCLGASFVSPARSFTGSTMTLTGGNVVKIVLGTASGATLTHAGNVTMIWTPSASATDVSGNPCSIAAVTESGAADNEF